MAEIELSSAHLFLSYHKSNKRAILEGSKYSRPELMVFADKQYLPTRI